MTAINAITRGEIGYMLADSVAYDEDGIFVSFAAKVATIPYGPTVCAVRGTEPCWVWAAKTVANFRSFDEVMEVAPAHLEAGYQAMAGPLKWTSFGLIAMGWSEKAKGVVAAIISNDEGFVFRPGEVIQAPLIDDDDWQRLRITRDEPDIAGALLRIMEVQRSTPYEFGQARDRRARVIGGAAVLTTVTRDKIEQCVIRQWPDTLGEAIAP